MQTSFSDFDNSGQQSRLRDEIEYICNRIMCKFPLLSPTLDGLCITPKNDVKTIEINGNAICYNPDWFMPLTDMEKIFSLTHEMLHLKFNHISRCLGRESKLWDIATDAVINQILKAENLAIPAGGQDMPYARIHSAEEVYEMLLQRRKRRKSNNQDDASNAYPQNHNKWEQTAIQNQISQSADNANQSDLEKSFCNENRLKRDALAELAHNQIDAAASQIAGNMVGNMDKRQGRTGQSAAAVDWRKLLMREMADNEADKWSYRRSDADNDFMARVEELEDENRPETEVILDVSDSVSASLLREFLRQLKPLLENSKLRVGFFNTEFYPFIEINNNTDIDNLHISGGGGTDMDVAVRNFSKQARVNKIVFTDGYGQTTDNSLKNVKNLTWLVYKSPAFKPLCGRVIYVDIKTIMNNSKTR